METLNAIEIILEKAHAEKRTALLETEVYKILGLAGLAVPKHFFYALPDLDPSAAALEIVAGLEGPKVVIKIVSSKTLHKTESGGVRIPPREKDAVEATLKAMLEKFPGVEGLMACEFAEHSPFALGEELMLGARADDAFGPVLTWAPEAPMPKG